MRHRHHQTGLLLIACFKLFKGAMLVAVGIGALSLLHHDVAEMLLSIVDALRVDPDNHFLRALIAGIGPVSDADLRHLGIGTLVYSGLFFTEGIGLWLEKRWAEYLTLAATLSYIPLEIYELARRLTIPRVLVIVVNVAVVAYLWRVLRRGRSMSAGVAGSSPPSTAGGAVARGETSASDG